MSIDKSELCALLSSRRSPNLHLVDDSGTEPRDALLLLPAHLIRNFVALRDVNSFVAEFSLRYAYANAEFWVMPDVNDATGRLKRFRYRLEGVDTVVRVSVYANRKARGYLTVVTFDHFRRTICFFNGNVPLADLKLTLKSGYAYY